MLAIGGFKLSDSFESTCCRILDKRPFALICGTAVYSHLSVFLHELHPFSSLISYKMSKFASKIKLSYGLHSCQDITEIKVDAIVNAANNSLLGGGGVDGAIHRAAGKELLKECRTLGGCADGEAIITKGYNLPAKHVIHTVGPRSEMPAILASCYINSLQVLTDNQLRSIGFPCIATGVYGYDNERACNVALTIVHDFLQDQLAKGQDKIDQIVFVLFNEKDKKIYKALLPEYFPGASTEC
ncbi:a1pp-domain-containing protein [Mucor ambiguus]|uniref:A1pp-domain-containing protein n=1 Tax=Mucor ambiguus TaxID=91626 RepID=A0A0C9M946_9FUNG|nr:a1pp-domain-containing protein [Mucor ambiguus]